jgi:hypothetical protein
MEAKLTYVTNGPIDAGFRVKRSEEDVVWELIVHGDPYIPLCCGRQMGKTTLMYQLRDRLRAEGFGAVYLYLGNMSDLAPGRFYEVICGDILKQLHNCMNKDVAPANAHNVSDQPAFIEFMEWIATKSERCTKVIVMLDEVGGVPHAFAKSFWGGLRSIFTRKGVFRRLMFVFAGELDMSVLATSNSSPLVNVCVTPFVELNDFTREEVAQLVAAGLPSSDTLVEAIYEWTSGHPYLTQKLCTWIESDRIASPAYWSSGKPQDRIDQLVVMNFLNQEDSNLLHLENYLDRAPAYRERVRQILAGDRALPTRRNRELAVLGVVKRGLDNKYRIRNRIYELAMRSYLEDYPEP